MQRVIVFVFINLGYLWGFHVLYVILLRDGEGKHSMATVPACLSRRRLGRIDTDPARAILIGLCETGWSSIRAERENWHPREETR